MKSASGRALQVVVLAALMFGAGAEASVSLRDRSELELALRHEPPCCVIDARSAYSRKQVPLPDATVYKEGITINPVGPVVVVADTDDRALQVGQKLAASVKDHPVLAVKGGAATWMTVTLPDYTTALPQSFVIPSNTCQQGPPLQTLPFERR